MAGYSARVENGRIVMDDPATDLPNGTVLNLIIDEEIVEEEVLEEETLENLGAEEKAALKASLDRSWAQIQAGQTYDAMEIARELRARYER